MEKKQKTFNTDEKMPLHVVLVMWIAGSWALALGATFFTLWVAAQQHE